jgi:hypothetical protein
MIKSNVNEKRLKYLFGRLPTLREDSQEDNHDIDIEQYQYDISEYDIIESIEGIIYI